MHINAYTNKINENIFTIYSYIYMYINAYWSFIRIGGLTNKINVFQYVINNMNICLCDHQMHNKYVY